jgi:hypothetical protein
MHSRGGGVLDAWDDEDDEPISPAETVAQGDETVQAAGRRVAAEVLAEGHPDRALGEAVDITGRNLPMVAAFREVVLDELHTRALAEHAARLDPIAPDAVAHPFPWRALCRHCGSALSKRGASEPWVVESLHGRDDECPKAPPVEGDPGKHAPVTALSANGPVKDDADRPSAIYEP